MTRLGSFKRKIGFTGDAVVEQVVQAASYLLHAQMPSIGVFHSDRFAVRVRVRVVFMRQYSWVFDRKPQVEQAIQELLSFGFKHVSDSMASG